MNVLENEILDKEIRIIKTKSCPSLSGKSTLKYKIGCTSEGEILVRLCKNSSPGKYSGQFISLNTILDLLKKAESPFKWSALTPIFKGQSINTTGFMMAVLKNEGLVSAIEEGYELQGADALKNHTKQKRARRAPKC